MSKILIIGCGYVGLPLALRLMKAGYEVSGWVHSEETAKSLKTYSFRQVIVGSVADEAVWNGVNGKHDAVIHCASSGRGGVQAYEEVFLKGAQMMQMHEPGARRLLVSSTSVYGQSLGEVVTEESPAEPISETSRMLREGEKVALNSGALVIRSAGIYGPGRGVLLEKFRRDEAVIEGDGLRWMNQIHQRDLVCALEHLIGKGEPGQIYNAADDTSVTHLDFYRWCSEFLHKPMPPYGPVNSQRKRGLTNKRVSNAKLRGMGWVPFYPSFREGVEAELS